MNKFVLIALFLASVPAFAQDALIANPKTVRLKIDNSDVRVLEASLPPGGKEQLHSHPASVLCIIAGGKIRNHSADGKTTVSVVKAGDVIYRDPLTHWTENIGKTTIHLFVIELKKH